MALKFGGKVYRTLEEQVLANAEENSALSEQVDDLSTKLTTLLPIEQVELSGSYGTLEEEQLETLQANEQNQIVCDNEIYRLMDNQAESGYLIYGHVGALSGTQTVKTITITISTLSWVKQSSEIESKEIVEFNNTSYVEFPTYMNGDNSIYKLTVVTPGEGVDIILTYYSRGVQYTKKISEIFNGLDDISGFEVVIYHGAVSSYYPIILFNSDSSAVFGSLKVYPYNIKNLEYNGPGYNRYYILEKIK